MCPQAAEQICEEPQAAADRTPSAAFCETHAPITVSRLDRPDEQERSRKALARARRDALLRRTMNPDRPDKATPMGVLSQPVPPLQPPAQRAKAKHWFDQVEERFAAAAKRPAPDSGGQQTPGNAVIERNETEGATGPSLRGSWPAAARPSWAQPASDVGPEVPARPSHRSSTVVISPLKEDLPEPLGAVEFGGTILDLDHATLAKAWRAIETQGALESDPLVSRWTSHQQALTALPPDRTAPPKSESTLQPAEEPKGWGVGGLVVVPAGSTWWVGASGVGATQEIDRVVNKGQWMIQGEQTAVRVVSSIEQRGFLGVFDGARLEKTSGAVVNNGVIAVTNGATFTDADIINGRTANGTLIVDRGSTVTATRSFVNGDRAGVTGLVRVAAGSHLQAGTLRTVDLVLGLAGYGILAATDSTVAVTGDLQLGVRNAAGGRVALSASTLSVNGEVQMALGPGTTAEFTLDQGSVLTAGDVRVGDKGEASLVAFDSTLSLAGDMVVGSNPTATGSVRLVRSSLEVEGDLWVASSSQAGGSLAVEEASAVHVEGDLNVGGHRLSDAQVNASGGSSLQVDGDVRVEESSIMSASQAVVQVGGDLEVEGALESHTAVFEVASDIRLREGSRVLGTTGTVFEVGGDFISEIKSPADFVLSGATVSFVDSPASDGHLLIVAGEDRGVSPDGYVDNFSLYAVSLAWGETLSLVDANGGGGALYVAVLDLQGGLAQLADVSTDGMNIYYDPSRPENAYLLGSTYEIGVNFLIPIPEPATAGLLLVGCCLVCAARGRRPRSAVTVRSTN